MLTLHVYKGTGTYLSLFYVCNFSACNFSVFSLSVLLTPSAFLSAECLSLSFWLFACLPACRGSPPCLAIAFYCLLYIWPVSLSVSVPDDVCVPCPSLHCLPLSLLHICLSANHPVSVCCLPLAAYLYVGCLSARRCLLIDVGVIPSHSAYLTRSEWNFSPYITQPSVQQGSYIDLKIIFFKPQWIKIYLIIQMFISRPLRRHIQ
jgi:hypothetical protein